MKRWVLGARPRTLPAAVVPVLVGTAAAHSLNGFTGWS
ncbi:MAG: 1,4-dihydroxy-2-naphthoate polyprenyltransferase, partial [Acidimicrobiales bacterium]